MKRLIANIGGEQLFFPQNYYYETDNAGTLTIFDPEGTLILSASREGWKFVAFINEEKLNHLKFTDWEKI